MEELWNNANVPQKIVIVGMTGLLISLLVLQIWFPGTFSTNIR